MNSNTQQPKILNGYLLKSGRIKVKKVKSYSIDQLTAWRTSKGIKVTFAFEDSGFVNFYNPNGEELITKYPKNEVEFLGVVEKSKKPRRAASKLKFEIEPVGRIETKKVVTDRHGHLGITKGCFVVIEDVKAAYGDFVAIRLKENNNMHFGFLCNYPDYVCLDSRNGQQIRFYKPKDVWIAGKIIGYYKDVKEKGGKFSVIQIR